MKFKVFIRPDSFQKIPVDIKNKIKTAIKELEYPYSSNTRYDIKEIKGANDSVYRLRIGNYRVFYRIDKENKYVYVFDILTAEQAHKKYGRL